ncbi:hypothetical protein ACLOJK_003938 [Asimina triloba]
MALQVLEATGIMRQQLKNVVSAELPSSGVDSLSLKVTSKDSSIQEEKSDAVEKSKTVAVAPQESAQEPETLDQWAEKDGEKGTIKQLGDEEDVSFSDLEVDDDDEVCSRNARSKSTHDACVSSSDGSAKWVQLNQDSEAHGDKSKAVRPTSQEKSSEGEDWLTVDDFDFDKV